MTYWLTSRKQELVAHCFIKNHDLWVPFIRAYSQSLNHFCLVLRALFLAAPMLMGQFLGH